MRKKTSRNSVLERAKILRHKMVISGYRFRDLLNDLIDWIKHGKGMKFGEYRKIKSEAWEKTWEEYKKRTAPIREEEEKLYAELSMANRTGKEVAREKIADRLRCLSRDESRISKETREKYHNMVTNPVVPMK